MKTLLWLCGMMALATACGSKPDSVGELPDGAAPSDLSHAAQASWNVTANFMVNGRDVQSAARSAVFGSLPMFTQFILTDVPDYCAALKAGKCPGNSNFHIEFDMNSNTLGAYSISSGAGGVSFGDVPTSCQGVGIGADAGMITLTQVDARPGGTATINFDFTSLGISQASGSINAVYCDGIPE